MENYSLHLIWSDKEDGYVASVPEIPHISLVASTAKEALVKLNDAVTIYLSEKNASREKVAQPLRIEDFSGQFRLRIPRTLHAVLSREAEQEGVSLNTYILHILGHRHSMHDILCTGELPCEKGIREIACYTYEVVSSLTFITDQPPLFSWRNDSTITYTHVQ